MRRGLKHERGDAGSSHTRNKPRGFAAIARVVPEKYPGGQNPYCSIESACHPRRCPTCSAGARVRATDSPPPGEKSQSPFARLPWGDFGAKPRRHRDEKARRSRIVPIFGSRRCRVIRSRLAPDESLNWAGVKQARTSARFLRRGGRRRVSPSHRIAMSTRRQNLPRVRINGRWKDAAVVTAAHCVSGPQYSPCADG